MLSVERCDTAEEARAEGAAANFVEIRRSDKSGTGSGKQSPFAERAPQQLNA
jgi:hypothetical protein